MLLLCTPALAQFDPMAMADTDEDGKVSPEEYAAFCEAGWGYFSGGADKVKVLDLDPMAKGAFDGIQPDADGAVSHAVYSAATPAKVKKADLNHNGSLNAAELKASIGMPG
jgi:hypothetical protein